MVPILDDGSLLDVVETARQGERVAIQSQCSHSGCPTSPSRCLGAVRGDLYRNFGDQALKKPSSGCGVAVSYAFVEKGSRRRLNRHEETIAETIYRIDFNEDLVKGHLETSENT
jgi:hypothetical protein